MPTNLTFIIKYNSGETYHVDIPEKAFNEAVGCILDNLYNTLERIDNDAD